MRSILFLSTLKLRHKKAKERRSAQLFYHRVVKGDAGGERFQTVVDDVENKQIVDIRPQENELYSGCGGISNKLCESS
ncbi:hypothetical protein [Halobacillus seohaensis]|uniref:Uncharacterized protein n=1 Tax=Halobacillus seohaensis TaxID=447421 RepID=A0ABW2EKP5_9BACI